MYTYKTTGRIAGVLFLIIFITGVTIYQFLQAPLFSENFVKEITLHRDQIIASTVLNMLNGIISIVIAILLLPIFKRYNYNLAILYFSFSILNFIAIAIDNSSIFSLLEFSKIVSSTESTETLYTLKTMLYEKHWWTHYISLLVSCLPVFVLYYTLFKTKLIPRIISIIGIIASLLMCIEMLSSIFWKSISMNLLLPMGVIQLILPFWLLVKGFKEFKA